MIKNIEKLGVSEERKKLLEILDYGLECTRPKEAVKRSLSLQGDYLFIQGVNFDLTKFKSICVIGIGKSSGQACEALEEILGEKLSFGYCIDVVPASLRTIALTIGEHKTLVKRNFSFSNAVVSSLRNLEKDDLVIAIISGGGSALFSYPYDSEHIVGRFLFEKLTQQGAKIQEINTVRKHLSLVKGGGLAKIVYPATLIGLIFSDVPGDDISFVASGPTVKDQTTVKDAMAILDKYNINEKIEFIETPKDDKYFERVFNFLVCSNGITLTAMKKKAEDLGLKARIWRRDFEADADLAAKILLDETEPGELLLAGGETTVRIRGGGVGGRNQQLVLSALKVIKVGEIVISCASDGYDNSDAAGAIADYITLEKANQLNLDIQSYISNNDSFNFFSKTGDQIISGLTGINISDLFLIYKK